MELEANSRLAGQKGTIQIDDALFSYVVIEHRLGTAGHADFLKVNDALSCFKQKIVDQEQVKDPGTGEDRLIIKMKQQETEAIMMAILGSGLKEDFHCYVY